MTVLDFPGKVACTIFTYGCNLRCPFCHNATLVIDEASLFSEEEIFSYINKRKGILDGVCVTGGEPLLQPDIIPFLKQLRETGLKIKLDTNGTYPDKLEKIISLGLVDYVAMDIKNSLDSYEKTVGTKIKLSDIEKSVKILLEGRVDYEFRTTVVKELHKIEDFIKIGELIRGAKRYFLQCFKDNENLIGENLSAHALPDLKRFLEAVSPYVSEVNLRGV